MDNNIHVSILTCAPGSEVYEQYGHTALRYYAPEQGYDIVFNYGVFSFDTPNFVWRFVKGETDYQLGIVPYPYFRAEYETRGSAVYQQELNLTAAEKQHLFELLEENYRPAHRTYRYNFFYDNCTTRARDMVERCVDGQIVYPESAHEASQHETFRDIVHDHTASTPWTQWGIDLLLGAEADAPIGQRERQFAPFHLRDDLRQATIQRGGEVVPLVLHETKIIPGRETPVQEAHSLCTPLSMAVLLLIIYIGIGAYEVYSRRTWWFPHLLLLLCQGLAGCVITLMFFCSTHPTVGSNWLVLLFNPVPLLCLPVMLRRAWKGQYDPIYRYFAYYLTIFIIFVPLIPQKFGITIVILALILCINAWTHVFVHRKNRKWNEQRTTH
jgi:hypothetical protein